jgi:hypothetical protein
MGCLTGVLRGSSVEYDRMRGACGELATQFPTRLQRLLGTPNTRSRASGETARELPRVSVGVIPYQNCAVHAREALQERRAVERARKIRLRLDDGLDRLFTVVQISFAVAICVYIASTVTSHCTRRGAREANPA